MRSSTTSGVDSDGDDPTDVATPRAPEDDSEHTGQILPDEDRTKTIRHNDGFELVPGTALGDYQIERLIGEGGMGVVYSAIHPIISKRVAVKVLKKELCSDPDSIERFIDEARAVNHIGHPNIVDIFSFGEVSGRCYLAMEWLQGESLRDRLAGGPLSLAEASAILRPLALALDAAHAKKVIHRDLKPDNVFLLAGAPGEPRRVKLLDFGLAKLGAGDPGVTRTAVGALLGTPQYIAPEQARGHAIDHRVDIYALGVVAFELLAGRPPFVSDNSMEMIAKHLMEPPPRLASLAQVPPALDDLIASMLAKDANDRPTIERVLATLELVTRIAAEPRRDPIVREPVVHAVVAEPRRRSRAGIAVGAVLVLVIAALAIVLVGTTGGHELVVEETPSPTPVVAPAPSESIPEPIAAPAAAPPPTAPEPDAAQPTSPPEPPRAEVVDRKPSPKVRRPVKPTTRKPDDPPKPKPIEKLPDDIVAPGTFDR